MTDSYKDLPLRFGGPYAEVSTYSELPVASSYNGKIFIVLNTTGIFPFSRSKGFYYSFGGVWSRLGDFSPGQIKELYEANANTNAFTDAYKSKLDRASEGEVLVPLNCVSDDNELQICTLSTSLDNTINTLNTNVYLGLAVGILKTKLSATSCLIQLFGSIEGYSGLQTGYPVFVGEDGTPTTTKPSSGHLQTIGTALSNSRILLDFNKQKVVQS